MPDDQLAEASPGPTELLVDARELRCPLPVLHLARAITRLAAPTDDGAAARQQPAEVVLWATDPAARTDVPAFCRMRGLTLLEVHERGGHTAYRVAVGAPGDPVSGPPGQDR